MRWPHSITFVLSVWLAVAPFPPGYGAVAAAVRNDVIVGFIVAVLATYRALEKPV